MWVLHTVVVVVGVAYCCGRCGCCILLWVLYIVMVVVDDLGSHDLGFTGSEIKTPAIDALAQAGIVLGNYYVQRLCSPTETLSLGASDAVMAMIAFTYLAFPRMPIHFFTKSALVERWLAPGGSFFSETPHRSLRTMPTRCVQQAMECVIAIWGLVIQRVLLHRVASQYGTRAPGTP